MTRKITQKNRQKQPKQLQVKVTSGLYIASQNIYGVFFSGNTKVKDKNGNILHKEEDQIERLKEHFCSVLNREDPENTAEIEMEQPSELDIDFSEITKEEIKRSIRKLKNNKAAGQITSRQK